MQPINSVFFSESQERAETKPWPYWFPSACRRIQGGNKVQRPAHPGFAAQALRCPGDGRRTQARGRPVPRLQHTAGQAVYIPSSQEWRQGRARRKGTFFLSSPLPPSTPEPPDVYFRKGDWNKIFAAAQRRKSPMVNIVRENTGWYLSNEKNKQAHVFRDVEFESKVQTEEDSFIRHERLQAAQS